jgi:hypothetical protein
MNRKFGLQLDLCESIDWMFSGGHGHIPSQIKGGRFQAGPFKPTCCRSGELEWKGTEWDIVVNLATV